MDNNEAFQFNKSTRRGNRINSSTSQTPSNSEMRTPDNEVETTWTEEEDEKLRISVLLYREKNWKKIAEGIPGKTPAQCMHRYKTVLNPDTLKVKGRWTPEEDQKLSELVQEYGTKNWRFIASHLKGRLPKQCRERWCNQLDPNIRKDSLTPKEWAIVKAAHEKFGNRWAEIAKLIPGRTANHIKNQWNTMLRRACVQQSRKRRREWEYDDDDDDIEINSEEFDNDDNNSTIDFDSLDHHEEESSENTKHSSHQRKKKRITESSLSSTSSSVSTSPHDTTPVTTPKQPQTPPFQTQSSSENFASTISSSQQSHSQFLHHNTSSTEQSSSNQQQQQNTFDDKMSDFEALVMVSCEELKHLNYQQCLPSTFPSTTTTTTITSNIPLFNRISSSLSDPQYSQQQLPKTFVATSWPQQPLKMVSFQPQAFRNINSLTTTSELMTRMTTSTPSSTTTSTTATPSSSLPSTPQFAMRAIFPLNSTVNNERTPLLFVS